MAQVIEYFGHKEMERLRARVLSNKEFVSCEWVSVDDPEDQRIAIIARHKDLLGDRFSICIPRGKKSALKMLVGDSVERELLRAVSEEKTK